MIKGIDTVNVYSPFVENPDLEYRGIIKKRNEEELVDTFFLKLWPISSPVGQVSSQNKRFKTLKNDNSYALVVEQWPVHNGYNSLDIPFATSQLSQLTIPLRFNLRTNEFSDDFLNVNISWSYIWGKTRFYESEFVKPRDRFIGIGGFGGLTATKNLDDKNEVGLMYGFNTIFSFFGVNFVVAAGAESSIGKRSMTSPFVGFGLDFDLFKLSGTKSGGEE